MDALTTVLTIISVVGTFSSVVFAFLAFSRNSKSDVKHDAADIATIKIDVKYTRDGVSRLERRLDDYEREQSKFNERLARVEEHLIRNDSRLDKLEKKRGMTNNE